MWDDSTSLRMNHIFFFSFFFLPLSQPLQLNEPFSPPDRAPRRPLASPPGKPSRSCLVPKVAMSLRAIANNRQRFGSGPSRRLV